jgi:hypothetical protein
VRCILKFMFDTVTGKFENGSTYLPKEATKNAWEIRTRDFFDLKLGSRLTSTTYALSRPEARIAIYGDGGILTVEASLPKLLHGNNLKAVNDPGEALERLGDFVSDYVEGDIPNLAEMDYLRVDYCHNFQVGSALPDYVHTLGKVSFLKHRRTTDGYGGVEWWSDNGRRIRAYDKHKEILEKDKQDTPEARGILRFEIQLRKKSGFLQRRQRAKNLKLQDVLRPEIAYCCLVETLEKMCLGLGFNSQDPAKKLLDENFSYGKATRLLGILWRLETGTMDDLRKLASRSRFYADKRELKALALWPPSAEPVNLPALAMPTLETILSAEAALCDSINTCEENTNAIEN